MKSITKNGTIITRRRKGALQRLEDQLKKGVKIFNGKNIPLEEKDLKRINKEINKLQTRLGITSQAKV